MEYITNQEEFTLPYAELTPEKFNVKMKENGCLMITGLFPASEIDLIKQETLDLFYIIKNLLKNDLINHDNNRYLAGGHPAGILPNLNSLEHVLNKPAFIDCLKQYFKKDIFEICVESTGIRRCDPLHWKNFLPWHQDLFHREDAFFTCWMPFMSIDKKTPGLDLIPKKVNQLFNNQDGLDVAYNGKGLTDEIISEKITPICWRPTMEVGDILIFDPYCPHRTSFGPDFTTERYSIDIRIQPKGIAPDKTWVTNVITLPSSQPYIQKEYKERSLFELRHLVSLNNTPPITAELAENIPETIKANRIKNLVKRIANKLQL